MADSAETTIKAAVEKTVKAQAQAAQQAEAVFQSGAEKAQAAQAAGAQMFRDMADKSAASFGQINTQSKQNLEAVVASATAAQKGLETLSTEAATFAKKSWDDNVAAAQSMAQARSVQELLELQTNWAKSATETYLSQMTRLTDVMTASVKDTLQPINARVAASVEAFQAAR